MEHQFDKRTIIIDSDPGQDDAIALLFALAAVDRLEVRAITVVAGNVPVDRAARNALVVRDWADRPEIPVYAGCRRPLVRELTTAESVHGKNGLDGVPLHEPQAGVSTGHAVDFLINTLRSSPEGSVTLCLIGPSTNFAAAVIQARCRSPNQGNRHDGRLLLHAGKRDASGGVQCVC